MHALQHGLQDSVMSVRTGACWALANVVDALWSTVHHETSVCGSSAHTQPAHQMVQGGDAMQHLPPHKQQQQQQQQQQWHLQPHTSLHPHQLEQLGSVCEAALAAATGDADKVRANGVRAVGGLLGLLAPSVAQQAGLDLDR